MLTKIQRYLRNNLFKKPTQVIIETTNHCNLNCPYCMVGLQNKEIEEKGSAAHSLMKRLMGYMDKSTFDRVINELKKFGIQKAYLHFQGEPFLNKLTPEFALQLKRAGFETGIFTNGQAFNDLNIAAIAEVGVDLIRFSVDGASEETYQKNRVGGQFAKVIDNMKKIVEAHKGKQTRIEWQFLPLKNNEHEVEQARSMAEEIGIHFFTKGFRETDPELAPENPEYRSTFLEKPCVDIYKQLGIYWNGDVVPCCYDVDASDVMGNINHQSLSEIWKTGKYTAFRKAVDSIKRRPEREPQLCKNCLRWK